MHTQYAVKVEGLSKQYGDFSLQDVSFCVPQGTIVGLIGENGTGKSTTIRMLLGLASKDGGTISILGKQDSEIDWNTRQQIGVVFDGCNYPPSLTPVKLQRLMKGIYPNWDEAYFISLLQRLSLPLQKKIKQFSKGMKAKLSLAAALAHHPCLLVLDEPTSGLDPIIRDDILDLFLEFVQDEHNSILVSSHITSDLEKAADYIVFLHQGRLLFEKPKDELTDEYGILKCGKTLFDSLSPQDILRYRRLDYEWQVLVSNRNSMQKKYPDAVIDPATIDEIMLFYAKGNR